MLKVGARKRMPRLQNSEPTLDSTFKIISTSNKRFQSSAKASTIKMKTSNIYVTKVIGKNRVSKVNLLAIYRK